MPLLRWRERLRIPAFDNPDHCRMARVTIDPERCNGCGMCVEVCVAAALEMQGAGKERRPRMAPGNPPCVACNDCMAICEQGAIRAARMHDFRYRYRRVLLEGLAGPRDFQDL